MAKGRDFEASVRYCASVIEMINGVIHLSGEEWSREQTVRIGLLLRIEHLIHSVLCLRQYEGTGEAIFALSRLTMESVTNLRYLLFKDDPDLYARFVTSSLLPEVELFDDIERRIEERGGTGEMPVEESMKRSVMLAVRRSDMTPDEVRSSPRQWGPNYRDRMLEMGEEEAYLYVQRLPSSAVHGDWVSLLRFYFQKGDEGYRRGQPDPVETDNLLNPIVALTCEAIADYAKAVHPSNGALVRSAELLLATVMEAEAESGDFDL